VLTPDQKGAAAELAVIHHAAALGLGVSRPLTDGHRYDLIFDLDGTRLLRVQCKSAGRQGDVLVVWCRSRRRAATGFITRPYTACEVDAIAAYCHELDRCYLLPAALFSGRSALQLRLAPPKNNQKVGINWASDYELAARITDYQGAVAQLGERLAGSQKVTGSSPVGSTLFT
jgi:PD-(D/E)XK nuclease superfamily protein